MKTFEQILTEVIEDDFREEYVGPETADIRAAKKYAKQWVEKAAEELNLAPRWDACLDMMKRNIDEQ
jgi:hypothetical protein